MALSNDQGSTAPEAGSVLAPAMLHHRQGRLGDAEAACRAVLSEQPRHADALRLLGIIAHQTGRVDLAIESIAKAVSINQTAALGHLDLARVYRTAGRVEEAIAACRQALQRKPRLIAAWLELASIQFAAGAHAEARQCADRAIQCEPTSAESVATLANLLRRLGNQSEALIQYRRAVVLAPDVLAVRNNLGTLLQEMGRLDEAVPQHLACLDRVADDVVSLVNLARAYQALGRFDDASNVGRRARDVAAGAPERYGDQRHQAEITLASVQIDMGRWGEAAMLLTDTVRRQPNENNGWYQLGRAYQAGGQPRESLSCFDAALKLAPNDGNVHLDRALLNIQHGQLGAGWDEYEWRWRAKRRQPRPIGLPRWDGGPIDGRTILVHGEQGVGDEIMFATCVPDLIRKAGHVVLTCEERLQPLFARSFPQATVRSMHDGPGARTTNWNELAAGADLEVPAGSLPRYFRRNIGDFPIRQPLLRSDPAKCRRWHERYQALGPGLKVGISWRAGARPAEQRLRSLPLAEWTELLGAPHVHWVNLQYGNVQHELDAAAHEGATVHQWPESDPLVDLDDFAAQIDALDLVISVGNATVHLAGALGRPVWALLPQHWGWRWFAGRTDSPWYSTAKLFRQQPRGGWPDVLRTARDELASRA